MKIKKILLGVALVAVALFIGLTIFYLTVVEPSLAKRKAKAPSKLAIQSAKVEERAKAIEMAEKSQPQPPAKPPVATIPVAKSKTIYPLAVQQQKVGSLWIDQTTSKIIVTLGSVQGLVPGSKLVVYDGEQRLGKVTVVSAQDVISYVEVDDISAQSLSKKYYKAVIE